MAKEDMATVARRYGVDALPIYQHATSLNMVRAVRVKILSTQITYFSEKTRTDLDAMCLGSLLDVLATTRPMNKVVTEGLLREIVTLAVDRMIDWWRRSWAELMHHERLLDNKLLRRPFADNTGVSVSYPVHMPLGVRTERMERDDIAARNHRSVVPEFQNMLAGHLLHVKQ